MSPTAIISLADIQFSYAITEPHVFDRLSLEIEPGTITALLGPNGSGKSTLLHLLLGVLSPQAGVILVARRDRTKYSPREFGQLVGLVSQDEYLPFNFTVLEYVLLGRAPHLRLLGQPSHHDRQVALDALAVLGLRSYRERPIQALSGGERQLVTVARALAQEPRILLLDEPTAHLDLGNQQRIREILRQLKAQGQTILFTTHAPNEAAAVADQVILLRAGKIQSVGDMHQVLTAAHLTATYGVEVQVVENNGRLVVLT
ncbi:MAG: ABC transporter ATP-binding protein [Chloroflexota bacterium]|nr:ABC transporter ATP-binding protein [Chloroflexota bacterium]